MAKPNQEFDKDYIFNLIMPTEPQAANPVMDDILLEKVEEAFLSEEEQAIQDSLAILKSKLFERRESVDISASGASKLMIVNLMEDLVLQRIDAAFEKFRCCKCDKCKKDVVVLALNTLGPRYVLAEPADIPALLESCSTQEVSGAIVKAILQVKNNPRH